MRIKKKALQRDVSNHQALIETLQREKDQFKLDKEHSACEIADLSSDL